MLLRRRYDACGGARGADIAFPDMQANIDSPGIIISAIVLNNASFTRNGLGELTAAPPAIVPSKQLLISMTFLTV
jgi:hypothetical protein